MSTLKFLNFMAWKQNSTEEVMDKLDMFQYRFGKIDRFSWWGLEIIAADVGTKFTSTEFKE